MDRTNMKKKRTSLLGFVLGMMILLAGVQGVWAQCKGMAYIRVPSTWPDVNIYYGNTENKILASALDAETGYYIVNLETITGNASTSFIVYTTSDGVAIDHPGVRSINKTTYDKIVAGRPGGSPDIGIACPGAGATVYITDNALNPGTTYTGSTPPDSKFFYALVPDEKEWQSDEVMISYTNARGVKKDTAMTPSQEMCGWVGMVFEEAPEDVVLYLKNKPEIQLGLNGLWGAEEVATPVNLKMLYDAFSTDKLYFIPDDNDWIDDQSQGWYTIDPGVPEPGDNTRCTFNLAAVIYDTDGSVNPLFTVDGDNTGFGSCTGVRHGIVMTDLGADGKPQFNASNANAIECFGNATNFATLFNYTQGKNEVQCYDMPFRHYGTDTRWGFDSDSMVTNDLIGGFSPLENSTDAGVVNGWGPLAVARTKRPAAGPVPNTAETTLGTPLDYYCSTPGWSVADGAKRDCEGLFANGDEVPVGKIWCWGSYCDPNFMRWGDGSGDNYATNEKRNQHFCFASHATFTYNESQEFTFRGDDDIWVFINKKIAVDNGGAHLAAPGHVVLKNLNRTYGDGFLVPGQDYPIDIFFCDRRTTMSNVIIKTNMYIKQSTGLDFDMEKVANDGLKMNLCVETTGGGDCASIALGESGSVGEQSTIECGDKISATVNYTIKKRNGDDIPGGGVLTPGVVNKGGIDLTNPKAPVVYPDKITLPPGSYRLYVEVNGKTTYYNFKVKGSTNVITEDVVFVNTDNEEAAYPTGTKWEYKDKALAGNRIPLYISAPMDGDVDLFSAAGQPYTLSATAGVNIFDSETGTTQIASLSRVINATGIDTLWVTIPLATLGTEPVKTCTLSVAPATKAVFSFYAPTIQFATPASTDPTTGEVLTWNPSIGDPDVDESGEEYFHWVGSDVDLYLIATDPITNSLCVDCNFPIAIVAKSDGIVTPYGDPVFANGVAVATIRSNKEIAAPDAGVITVASLDNASIFTAYGNMHFYPPPAPMPVVADIFDVYGKVSEKEMEIPSPYYAKEQKYLDGFGDSIAITYDRPIDPDSVPSFVCINFDDDNLKKINPFAMGLSSYPKDSVLFCSHTFDAAAVQAAYAKSLDHVSIGFSLGENEAFSSKVKTKVKGGATPNKVASFTQYKWKGKEVKASFEQNMTDRIAPIILSAQVMPSADGSDLDVMTVVLSEPAVLNSSYSMEGFQFYLNTATELGASARYRAAVSKTGFTTAKDTVKILFTNNDVQRPSPHVGDYVRFRVAADEVLWSDTVSIAETAVLRPTADASYTWNSPTDYDPQLNRGNRLPSPWVLIEGAAELNDASINIAMSDPEKAKGPSFEATFIPAKWNLDSVKVNFPNTLGKFLKMDIKSLSKSKEIYANVKPQDVYFYYEMDVFTNLGAFVVHKDEKILCTDEKYFGEGKTCFDENKNVYISWNMTAQNNRMVGSGAYIVKWSSYVNLGAFGKQNKQSSGSSAEVWGVRHGKTKK